MLQYELAQLGQEGQGMSVRWQMLQSDAWGTAESTALEALSAAHEAMGGALLSVRSSGACLHPPSDLPRLGVGKRKTEAVGCPQDSAMHPSPLMADCQWHLSFPRQMMVVTALLLLPHPLGEAQRRA